MLYLNGKTTVVRAGPMQAVRLTRRARRARGVEGSNMVLMRHMIPIYAASIGMMTPIRPKRKERRARNATTSNSGLQAASLDAQPRQTGHR